MPVSSQNIFGPSQSRDLLVERTTSVQPSTAVIVVDQDDRLLSWERGVDQSVVPHSCGHGPIM